MSHRIACYTLFDITRTGTLNRAKPGDDVTDINQWLRKRNTQCNFDTILQVVSLRSQPDVSCDPKQLRLSEVKNSRFGALYKEKNIPVWTFDFEIHHASVFEDGIEELGYLYKDCNDVPMVKCDTQYHLLGTNLDITNEKRNIYFVKY
jgi:hypothetical protein